MATKIDLLPGYVRLQKQRNMALGISVASLGVVASVLLLLLHQKKLELETAETNRDTYQKVADASKAAKAEADKFRNEYAPISGTVSWVLSANKTGPERAALFNLLRQYIYENTVITTIDITDGAKVKMGGTVRDPNEYAQFLLNLRRASDTNGGPLFTGLPTATGPGGFANSKNPAVPFVPPSPDPLGQPVQILYPVKMAAEGVLKNPVVIPPDPVAPAQPAQGEGQAPPPGA